MEFELIVILLGIIGAVFWNKTTRMGDELMNFHHSFSEIEESSCEFNNEEDGFELNDITGMHNMN